MRTLIADDHPLIRDAFAGVLRDLVDGVQVVEAPDAATARRLANAQSDLELVIIDLKLPDGTGFDLLEEVRRSHPMAAAVVLSVSQSAVDIARALDLGAAGFIPKSTPRAVMQHALALVLAGGIYIPPQALVADTPSTAPTVDPASAEPDLGLTERQREVLRMLMQGKTNKAIARALDVAEPTVKNHITAVLKALDASNRTEAVVAAAARGFGRAAEVG